MIVPLGRGGQVARRLHARPRLHDPDTQVHETGMSRSPRVARVAIAQMAMSPSREDNLAKASKFVAEAASSGGGGVVLPEVFADRDVGQRMDVGLYALAGQGPGGGGAPADAGG